MLLALNAVLVNSEAFALRSLKIKGLNCSYWHNLQRDRLDMFRSLDQKDVVLSCAEEVVVWDSFDGSLLFFMRSYASK
jgi:hypothetical protein